MKKFLSILLAVSMLLAMGSGMVLFGANAAAVKMPFKGFDNFTLDEAAQFAVLNGKFSYTESNGHIVINVSDFESDGWGSNVAIHDPAKGADQWAKNELINGKSFFDIDMSNKQGFKFKIVNTGAEGTVPYTGKINFCFGSSKKQIALDYKDVKVGADGYYTVDWAAIGSDGSHQFVGWGDYLNYGSIADTGYKAIDQVKIVYFGKPGEKYSFYIDDLHAYGTVDTISLGATIEEAKSSGVLSSEVIAEAEALYYDTKATQEVIDAKVEELVAAMEEAQFGYDKAISDLDALLNTASDLGFFDDPESPEFAIVSEADVVFSDPDSNIDDILEQIAIVRLVIAKATMDADVYAAFAKCINAWEYNYTKASFTALAAKIDQAWELAETDAAGAVAILDAAYDALISVNVRANTGNLLAGWTTEDVNAVFEANPLNGENPNHVESIGDGLNADGVYNAGDFSLNTIFEANDNFSMTADADFTGKAMGWKNMDRSGTLAGVKNGAYPALNVAGLSASDGIRFKLDVDGSVGRILIGLSNCANLTREMYAKKLVAGNADANGYINIPFSYFEDAWWCKDSFSQEELEDVIVLIVEAYDVTEGTKITISDMTGYVNLGAASEDLKSKVADVTAKLEAFDVGGRYADVIAAAKALSDEDYDVDYQDMYDRIFDILKGYKDPDSAIVDVPGFSIYSQDELNQIVGLSGGNVFTKTERGFMYKIGPGDYAFANGIYVPGTGFEDSRPQDPHYGALTPIGGKTFVDMLGGYKLADIYAFRFTVDNPTVNKKTGKYNYMGIHFKDGVGLWDGMLTIRYDAYPDEEGRFTYYVDQIPIGPIGEDGWYGKNANTKENILNNSKYIMCEFFLNENRDIHSWQVIVYESIDRAPLKDALTALAGLGVEGYDAAMEVYYDENASEDEIAAAAEKLLAASTPKAPEAPKAAEITDTSVTLVAGAKNLEYKLGENGEWTTSVEFTGLTPNTEYKFYARVAATDILPASDASEALTVTTLKTAIAGEAVIEGNAVYGETLTAVALDSNTQEFIVDWYRDGKLVAADAGFTYTLGKDDIGTSINAVMRSDSFSGELVSEATVAVVKATPVIETAPDAVVLFIGDALENGVIANAVVNVEGTWSWQNPTLVPDINQSGSTFTAIFTPADTDCYDAVTVDVVVIVDTNTTYRVVIDDSTGIELWGEFVDGKEIATAITDIEVGTSAYLAMLRAARSASDKSLILFKNLALNTGNAYLGTLELVAELGADRAGESYTVWYFADGEVRSATGVVGADGFITVSGIVAGVAA